MLKMSSPQARTARPGEHGARLPAPSPRPRPHAGWPGLLLLLFLLLLLLLTLLLQQWRPWLPQLLLPPLLLRRLPRLLRLPLLPLPRGRRGQPDVAGRVELRGKTPAAPVAVEPVHQPSPGRSVLSMASRAPAARQRSPASSDSKGCRAVAHCALRRSPPCSCPTMRRRPFSADSRSCRPLVLAAAPTCFVVCAPDKMDATTLSV